MKYVKPHLPYDQQLQRIVERGMPYADQKAAVRALQHIGYYRFSAYTYPFRQFNPTGADGRPSRPRPDAFQEGSLFEHAVALHDFDQSLRRCLANGLEDVEIGLRTQIAYTLGKTDPFGHLDGRALDAKACAVRIDGSGTTAHEKFLEIFDGQRNASKDEEFVKHFILKYGGEMPIWVAAEFMSFGLLVRLYALLNDKDANSIATALGVRDRKTVHLYLKALNVLRNDCAHHCRVWNRSTVFPPRKPPKALVHERIHHLHQADANRLYPLAALTAHFAIQLNPSTNWPRKFKEVMKDFSAPLGMSPEKQMGFPEGWQRETIWAYDPRTAKA